MSNFTVGCHVEVVDDSLNDDNEGDRLIGWTGVVTKVWFGGDLTVDLDPEQDPDFDLTGLLFAPHELIVLRG